VTAGGPNGRRKPPPSQRPPPGQPRGAVLGVVVLALLGFAAFFVGFLLAPLAILLIFCLVFAARNRSGGRKKDDATGAGPTRAASGLEVEAKVRREALAREPRRGAAARQPAGLAPTPKTSDEGDA
jgi:hypothetical protein